MLAKRVPNVLRSELYAIPALVGATIVVLSSLAGLYGVSWAIAAAVVCFGIWMIGVRYDLNAPKPGTQATDFRCRRGRPRLIHRGGMPLSRLRHATELSAVRATAQWDRATCSQPATQPPR